MFHADVELATTIEAAEARIVRAMFAGLTAVAADNSFECVDIGSGTAVWAGLGSPISEARGVGLPGPVEDAEIDQLISVYHSRGAQAKVFVCPLADASLFTALGARGFRLEGFESTLALDLGTRQGAEDHAALGNITVRPAEPQEADLYADVVFRQFLPPDDPIDPLMRALCVGAFRAQGAHPMFAEIEGTPVGGGMLVVSGTICLLAGAATRPEFRKRGVHGALARARLDLARSLDCRWAAWSALPGSTSQRNAERHGFQLAYTRGVLVLDPPSS
jgi:hypothetical protein